MSYLRKIFELINSYSDILTEMNGLDNPPFTTFVGGKFSLYIVKQSINNGEITWLTFCVEKYRSFNTNEMTVLYSSKRNRIKTINLRHSGDEVFSVDIYDELDYPEFNSRELRKYLKKYEITYSLLKDIYNFMYDMVIEKI